MIAFFGELIALIIINGRFNEMMINAVDSISHMLTISRLTDMMVGLILEQAKCDLNFGYNKIISPVCDNLLLTTKYETAYFAFPIILDIDAESKEIEAVIEKSVQKMDEQLCGICDTNQLFTFNINNKPYGSIWHKPIEDESIGQMLDKLYEQLKLINKSSLSERTQNKAIALSQKETYMFGLSVQCDKSIPLRPHEIKRIEKSVFSMGEIFSRQTNEYGGLLLMCAGFSMIAILPKDKNDVPNNISHQLCDKLEGIKGAKNAVVYIIPAGTPYKEAFDDMYIRDSLENGCTILYDEHTDNI